MGLEIMSPNEWVPQNIKLEKAAMEAVVSSSNTLIIAGPGASKTEMLSQRACFLLQTNTCPSPKRILALSFKKDAASNLSERVLKRCGKILANRLESLTFDAFAKEILDRFYMALPENFRPAKDYFVDLNSELLRRAYELARLPYVRESATDDKTNIKAPVMKILLHGNKNADFPPALTFTTISRLANYLLKENTLIIKALQLTYSHIFLDEFQDTTTVQYNLAKTCFLSTSCIITAVGDQKQRIMGWAGAMYDAFDKFQHDFGAVEKVLVMNHRSVPKLVNAQYKLYSILSSSDLTANANVSLHTNEGCIMSHTFASQIDEANYLKNDIRIKLNNGIQPRDICILTKRSISEYCHDLLGDIEGTNFAIRDESVYQDLLKEDLVKVLYAFQLCGKKNRGAAEAFEYLQELYLQFNSVEIDDADKVNICSVQL